VTLKLELIDDRDIVVSHPESGFSVTYRKTGNEPMLIAIDGIDRVADGVKGEVLGSSLESRLSKGPRTRLAKLLTLSAPSPLVLYDPPQLARLVVGCLPRASKHHIVVGLRAALEDELRLIGRLVVDGAEIIAWQRNDEFPFSHYARNFRSPPIHRKSIAEKPDERAVLTQVPWVRQAAQTHKGPPLSAEGLNVLIEARSLAGMLL
jgi:hypothetical protein